VGLGRRGALSCRFGETGFDEVVAYGVLADVPGKVIPSVALTLVYDKNSDGNTVPVTGVKAYLTDKVTNKIVAAAVSDSAGSATFATLPAGLYEIGLVGPWRTAGTQGTIWPTRMGSTNISVEPGPDQPDPTAHPTNPPTTNVPVSPAAQASPTLADTGVEDVFSLSLAAGGALGLGVGLLLSRRRRTS
jgi:LPXTG-motif cell wall-anchored protein